MHENEKSILIETLKKEVLELRQKIAWLEDKNAELLRRLFGSSSERVVSDQKINEAEAIADTGEGDDVGPGGTDDADEEKEEEKEENKKSDKKKKKGGRNKLPKNLIRCVEVKDLIDKNCSCGSELKFVGDQISEKLSVIPAKFYVQQTILKKYSCPCCTQLITPEVVPTILPRTNATPSLLAMIVVAKYGNSLPLYRQESILLRMEVSLSRQTMARWIIMVSKQLHPIITLLKEIAFTRKYLQMDETSLQVLNEPGRAATSKSYMWVMSSPEDNIFLYHYASTRSGDIPAQLLEGYKGLLQVDGYDGYNQAVAANGLTRLGCWMHARRDFFEASKSKQSQKIGEYALKLIKKIYKIEERIKDETIENRLLVRQQESLAIAQQLKTWCENERPRVTPSSYGGQAIGYLLNEWIYLERCFQHGNVSLDNGNVERHIRPFTIGRNNWLFADTVSGAEASADFYSLQVTAVANGYNPEKYFENLFIKLPLAQTLQDFLDLLPLKKIPPLDLGPPPD